ncbi:hypothetical protein FOCC_FOCC016528, partial [Frankliniella occidentalis]
MLVAVEMSSPSRRVAAACAARRRAGGRSSLVALGVTEPHLRVLALDNAFADPQPVLHVNLVRGDLHEATLKDQLGELLPQSQAALVALANSTSPYTRTVPLPSSFGGPKAKSHEVPPVFLVGGLADSPVEQMKPLARLLMANAVLLVPGAEDADVPSMAASMVKEILAHQATGPYTVVARGWAGCVGLEMARLLEQRGARVALMLLDCAPRDLQAAVQGLERGGQRHAGTLQAWLLCSLLHMAPSTYDVIEALPSWPARLEHALDVTMGSSPQRAAVAKALDLVFVRLRALANYSTDFKLKQTVVTLLRPTGAEPDDYRGLDKVSELNVMVEVVDSALGTADYWRAAARIVSSGLYVGSKPMHQLVIGKQVCSDNLWSRL